LHALEDNYKAIQTENYSLREYIIHLQSRLIESHGEYPQPPANINLNHPSRDSIEQLQRHAEQPTAPMGLSQLQASAAQAVAGLSNKRNQDEAYLNPVAGPSKRFKEATDSSDPSEELSRQLQASADSLPVSSSLSL